ncbi:hypothetical protein HID58_067429 [Brassica napus]|uniref:RRM domain-containing protein n=1 Tax=Brassica napus TaxID=3708 RepID=A0ABQ7ZIH9_BRANA|nr:hypothetical protein HID58_067429 [Brassica napus]
MHDHFIKYGDILKVFIIFDKFTHRSKGYGFNVSRPRQDMWGKIKLNGTRPLTLPRPPNMTFNQKVGYIRGTYMNGYYAQPQPQPLYYNHHHLYGGGRDMVGASPMMPLYTFYPYHQSQAIGFTQPSFTKPISTHPISGILSFYPKPYNVS